jgi:hypothetical protein
MFSGPPLPLPQEFPIRQLLPLLQSSKNAGAWLRGCRRELRLSIGASEGCSSVIISGDLGRLLKRCDEIVVREGARPVMLRAELLIQWRALQVVTATPYLPCLEWLRDIFPGAHLETVGFRVPIDSRAPEDVLADCLIHGIPVASTRIIYRAPAITPRPVALNRVPSASGADFPPAPTLRSASGTQSSSAGSLTPDLHR